MDQNVTLDVDMDWGRRERLATPWPQVVGMEDLEAAPLLPRCTYAGRPFENEGSVLEMSQQFGCYCAFDAPESYAISAASLRSSFWQCSFSGSSLSPHWTISRARAEFPSCRNNHATSIFRPPGSVPSTVFAAPLLRGAGRRLLWPAAAGARQATNTNRLSHHSTVE